MEDETDIEARLRADTRAVQDRLGEALEPLLATHDPAWLASAAMALSAQSVGHLRGRREAARQLRELAELLEAVGPEGTA